MGTAGRFCRVAEGVLKTFRENAGLSISRGEGGAGKWTLGTYSRSRAIIHVPGRSVTIDCPTSILHGPSRHELIMMYNF